MEYALVLSYWMALNVMLSVSISKAISAGIGLVFPIAIFIVAVVVVVFVAGLFVSMDGAILHDY